jgi:hypothetical protein
MDSSDFYIPLSRKCAIYSELLSFAQKVTDAGWGDTGGFMSIPVPHEIVDADPLLLAVKKVYRTRYGLLCLPPNTCYPWHKDIERGAILNMPLNGHGKSSCVFTRKLEEGKYIEFAELSYEPQTYYIFNAQKQHMVLNYTEKRYLFSFTLLGVRDLPFRQMVDSLLAIEAELLKRPGHGQAVLPSFPDFGKQVAGYARVA